VIQFCCIPFGVGRGNRGEKRLNEKLVDEIDGQEIKDVTSGQQMSWLLFAKITSHLPPPWYSASSSACRRVRKCSDVGNTGEEDEDSVLDWTN
jgi:hypothetical protein